MRSGFPLLILSLLGSSPAFPAAAYFSAQDNLQQHVTEAINGSQVSLDVAVFELTSKPLIRALRQAAERGVTVRLLVNANSPHAAIAHDFLPNLEVRFLQGRRGGIMHNKFMVVDDSLLFTGSFNWTPGAQYANYENILMEDDSQIVDSYHRQFETLWGHASQRPKKSFHHHRKGHPL